MKKELIPFLMAGDPNLEATERFVTVLANSGIQKIELGVPFSDPLADGVPIQRAAERALRNSITLKNIFSLCERLQKKNSALEIILFSYLNPILQYGMCAYVHDAKNCGVAASLVVDLSLEEAQEYVALHRDANLGTIFLAAPTTSHVRIRDIASASTNFLYYVSRAGITGEQNQLSTSLVKEIASIRSLTNKAIAVGFGISSPEQAKQVAQYADYVVIGSKFISLIAESASVSEAESAIGTFARECLKAMNGN